MNRQRTTTVNTKRDASHFRKAAKAYVETVTKSQKSARKALVELGTHTKKGKITRNYK